MGHFSIRTFIILQTSILSFYLILDNEFENVPKNRNTRTISEHEYHRNIPNDN